jgi:hypothetical protein
MFCAQREGAWGWGVGGGGGGGLKTDRIPYILYNTNFFHFTIPVSSCGITNLFLVLDLNVFKLKLKVKKLNFRYF